MRYRSLMTVHSMIAVPAGVACILAPVAMLATYGLTLPSMGLVIYQLWGAALVGLGILTWVARDAGDLKAGFSSALAFLHGINCVLSVRGQAAGANDLGWSMVGLFLALALAFGYVRFADVAGEEPERGGGSDPTSAK